MAAILSPSVKQIQYHRCISRMKHWNDLVDQFHLRNPCGTAAPGCGQEKKTARAVDAPE
jgi:hypothetical protein